MQSTEYSARSLTPRLDLVVRRDRFTARAIMVFDRIANRIIRLSAADWQRLQNRNILAAENDPLWQMSQQAGLLQGSRQASDGPSSLWRRLNPLRLLVVRIPLFSIDTLAQFLARHSDWLFSPLAIMLGVALYLCMLSSVAMAWDLTHSSLQELIQTNRSLAGMGLSSLVVFVLIKLIHELAHATACRRSGAAVGYLGLMFFLGMPSPYCDVSTISTHDSRWTRAAVMAAGVYVEMMLAVLATCLWWLTAPYPESWLHIICFQVMLVSGISTLLFNLNPLMKLDGYFVLSDVLNVPNLRQEAGAAARRIAQCGIKPVVNGSGSLRTVGLGIYHALSTVYRWSVLLAISLCLLSLFTEWHLAWVGIAIWGIFAMAMTMRLGKGILAMAGGKGSWGHVRLRRRLGLSLAVLVGIVAIAMWPLSRELESSGVIDAVDAAVVYAYEQGIVQQVDREYGDWVDKGELLVKLQNDDVRLQTAAVANQKLLAEMESSFLSRRALQQSQHAVSWDLDQAKRNLLETQFVSLKQREQQLEILAPVAGVIMPPTFLSHFTTNTTPSDFTTRLNDRVGMSMARQAIWCRIGNPSHVAVYCRLNAAERQLLQVDSSVRFLWDTGTVSTCQGRIAAIEEWLPPADGLSRKPEFIARCELTQPIPATAAPDQPLPLGGRVTCLLFIEEERVWQRIARLLHELIVSPMTFT